MSTSTDLIAAAVLTAPAAIVGAAYALTLRGSAAHSAAVRQVLAESAAERATATDDGTPPDGREPAPETTPAPAAHLATVINFPAHRRAA